MGDYAMGSEKCILAGISAKPSKRVMGERFRGYFAV
jgi:hypothetical protein